MRGSNIALAKEIALIIARICTATLKLAVLLTLGTSLPALASPAPKTRLVSCGQASCLMVTGHRDSRSSQVRINGHRVDVQGNRVWRINLPVNTVRDWSPPFARHIEVSTQDAATQEASLDKAILPIGMLGHVPDLASLVITLH